jgi:hypothetical protein
MDLLNRCCWEDETDCESEIRKVLQDARGGMARISAQNFAQEKVGSSNRTRKQGILQFFNE